MSKERGKNFINGSKRKFLQFLSKGTISILIYSLIKPVESVFGKIWRTTTPRISYIASRRKNHDLQTKRLLSVDSDGIL